MNTAQKIVFWLSVFLIISLVYIAQFNVYQTDDFIFAYSREKFGALESFITNYTKWGGRYTGYGLNVLNPLSFDSNQLFPKVYPIALIVGFIILLALNIKIYFQYEWKKSWIKSMQFFFFYCVSLVAFSEHYFWVTGATIYNLGILILLAFTYSLGKFKRSNDPFWKFVALALLLPLMGFNEILSIFVLGHLSFQWFRKKTKIYSQFLAVGLVGFLVLFLAPGNFVRLPTEEVSVFKMGYRRIGFLGFNSAHILIKSLLIAPLFIKVFEKEILFFIQRFGLIRVIKFWLLSFVPMLFTAYLLNVVGRQFELIMIYFLITFSALLFYYIRGISSFWVVSLIVLFIPKMNLFQDYYSSYNLNFNLFGIISDISNSTPQKFEREIISRYNFIKNSKEDTVKLKSISEIPATLYFDELSKENEPKKFTNDQLEKYFQKKSISVETK